MCDSCRAMPEWCLALACFKAKVSTKSTPSSRIEAWRSQSFWLYRIALQEDTSSASLFFSLSLSLFLSGLSIGVHNRNHSHVQSPLPEMVKTRPLQQLVWSRILGQDLHGSWLCGLGVFVQTSCQAWNASSCLDSSRSVWIQLSKKPWGCALQLQTEVVESTYVISLWLLGFENLQGTPTGCSWSQGNLEGTRCWEGCL